MDDVDLTSIAPLEGGWSGETFVGQTAGEKVVVRIYAGRGLARGPQAPEVDAAVMHLVRGLVPVPDVAEVRRPDAAAGLPGLLVSAWVDGVRGDLLLPTLDDEGLHIVGRAVGRVVADLAGMPMIRTGAFTDSDLALGELGGADTLVESVQQRVGSWGGWSGDEVAGLLEVADQADVLLDTVARRCLVHGDLNPKNLLLDPRTLAITAVLDWEFAHAGHPATDLGNVLRLDRAPSYVAGVLEPVVERHGWDADRALLLGRAADLWSLVDLADRAQDPASANPVAVAAEGLLRGVARSRDLMTPPAGGTGTGGT